MDLETAEMIDEEMKLNTPGKHAFHSPFLFFPKMFPFHRNVYDSVEGGGSETVFPWQFATMFFLSNSNYNQLSLGLSVLKHAAPFLMTFARFPVLQYTNFFKG